MVIVKIDSKNCEILQMLHKNSRASLTEIAKNAIEQGKIINSWSESLTITAHKFEDYNFKKLFLEDLHKE